MDFSFSVYACQSIRFENHISHCLFFVSKRRTKDPNFGCQTTCKVKTLPQKGEGYAHENLQKKH